MSGRARTAAGYTGRLVAACLMSVGGMCTAAVVAAPAAVTHAFLPSVSAKIDEGVPIAAPVGLTGPLGQAIAMGADAGHLWVAERLELEDGVRSRVDEVNAQTGELLGPHQLDEEGGLNVLGFAGIAVGSGTGEEVKYVTAGEQGRNVIALYGATDTLQSVWRGTSTPGGSFGVLHGVALDDSLSLETGGDLYVAAGSVLDVFKPQPGMSEPAATVGRIVGTCHAAGVCSEAEAVPFEEIKAVAVSGFNGDVLVADGNPERCGTGNARCGIDVFEPVAGMPGIYSYLFKIKGTPSGAFKQIGPLSVDASDGNIYVLDEQEKALDEYDPAGRFLGRLVGVPAAKGETLPFSSPGSVAVDPTSENVFLGTHDQEKKSVAVAAFGRDLLIPDVLDEGPLEVGPRGARLRGRINPDNEGDASCRFTWGTGPEFGQLAPCEPETVAEGSSSVSVRAQLSGLEPDSTYYYRLQATNKNGLNPGEEWQDQRFTTSGPGLHGESALSVSATAVTLQASIDPDGSHTSYYFQYGRNAEYEAEIPLAPGVAIGSERGDVQVERRLQGLAPNTAYHYRVVAVSEVKAGEPEAFPGPDQVFITQVAGAASTLADGRQWELVSPPQKHGAQLLAVGETGVIQAAASGKGLAYLTSQPIEGAAGYQFNGVQILSERSPGGWYAHEISLAKAAPVGLSAGFGKEYRFFASDLSSALVEPMGVFTSLADEGFPPDTERTPYLRHDSTCEASSANCFEPLLTGATGYADVPEGVQFGGDPDATGEAKFFGEAHFVGATDDLTHAILESHLALTPTATGGQSQLYEWSAAEAPAQRLQLVSLLPANVRGEELPATSTAYLGLDGSSVRGAISQNGSRVFWSDEQQHLYLRDVAKRQTIQLDLPEAECSDKGECGEGPVSATFQLASSDGSRVFFSDRQRLTADASGVAGKADLYECRILETAGSDSCRLNDLTPATGEEASGLQGTVIGASENGSWLYFVADGILGDGAQHGAVSGDCGFDGQDAPQGECNLYVRHEGITGFIGTLTAQDYPDWSGFDPRNLNTLTARVSPNGQWLAFMSNSPLTGYDNKDVVSGQPDEEVFLYHAGESEGRSLVCASCDPTRARPAGVPYARLDGALAGGDRVWPSETGIAANIPGWTPYKLSHALYQSRYLSNQGRLFFDSADGLVPADINHDQDVYEYERPGVGDCSISSPTYGATSDGCVNLISSGTAAGESAFLDASESGDDVFFLTDEKLVVEDTDTALDIYDARACTSASPCSEMPPAPTVCMTVDACRTASSSTPPTFGAPASATFSGSGNVAALEVSTAKPRTFTSAQKLARMLVACEKKRNRHKRAGCLRQARKRYRVNKPHKSGQGKR